MNDRPVRASRRRNDRHLNERLSIREIDDDGRSRRKVAVPETAIGIVHRAKVRGGAEEDEHRDGAVERRTNARQRSLHLFEDVPRLSWNVAGNRRRHAADIDELTALDSFWHSGIVSRSTSIRDPYSGIRDPLAAAASRPAVGVGRSWRRDTRFSDSTIR